MGARMNLGFDDLDTAAPEAGQGALPALDTSGFAPKKRARVAAPELSATKEIAEGLGFRSREPRVDPGPEGPAKADPVAKAKPTAGVGAGAGEGAGPRTIAKPRIATEALAPNPPVRRRRTGRNVQFNIKTRPETIAAFTAIADANDWGFGETLEHMVALMESGAKG